MNLTRRRFLGGLLASVPLAYVPLSRWRMKEADYVLMWNDLPPVKITSYTDGTFSGVWQGVELEVRPGSRWTKLSAKIKGEKVQMFAANVSRDEPNVLTIDQYAYYVGPEDSRLKLDGDSLWLSDWGSPTKFSYQPLPPLLT
jgi:hypothetical protein